MHTWKICKSPHSDRSLCILIRRGRHHATELYVTGEGALRRGYPEDKPPETSKDGEDHLIKTVISGCVLDYDKAFPQLPGLKIPPTLRIKAQSIPEGELETQLPGSLGHMRTAENGNCAPALLYSQVAMSKYTEPRNLRPIMDCLDPPKARSPGTKEKQRVRQKDRRQRKREAATLKTAEIPNSEIAGPTRMTGDPGCHAPLHHDGMSLAYHIDGHRALVAYSTAPCPHHAEPIQSEKAERDHVSRLDHDTMMDGWSEPKPKKRARYRRQKPSKLNATQATVRYPLTPTTQMTNPCQAPIQGKIDLVHPQPMSRIHSHLQDLKKDIRGLEEMLQSIQNLERAVAGNGKRSRLLTLPALPLECPEFMSLDGLEKNCDEIRAKVRALLDVKRRQHQSLHDRLKRARRKFLEWEAAYDLLNVRSCSFDSLSFLKERLGDWIEIGHWKPFVQHLQHYQSGSLRLVLRRRKLLKLIKVESWEEYQKLLVYCLSALRYQTQTHATPRTDTQ